ncbi:MAG: hypothetical protein HRT35_36715 [Algicola sp.]|nr:hypothetical protein [Algicola sp.]
MKNIKFPGYGVLKLGIAVILCFSTYFVASIFVTTGWAAIIAVVTSLFVFYIDLLAPFLRKKRFFYKTLLLGELVQDKPYKDEFKIALGWIHGYGYTADYKHIMAWKPEEDGIILHLFCATRKGSIKLDWQVIRQIIIYTNTPALVELIIDDLDFRLLLPYDFEELNIPDSVSLLRKFDLDPD